MTRSRRQFMKLLAAGAAAAAAGGPAGALARTTRRVRTARRPATPHAAPAPAPPDALAVEIRKQKGYVTTALKTLRAYELPPGSTLALVFRPLPAWERTS
jgi:hypothetical protein